MAETTIHCNCPFIAGIHYRNGLICRTCYKEWYLKDTLPEFDQPAIQFNGYEHISPTKIDKNYYDIMPIRRSKVVPDVAFVGPGDHIMWHRPWLTYHHAIVERVTDEKFIVIRLSFENSMKRNSPVQRDSLDIGGEWGALFKYVYSDEINQHNPGDLVLARARALREEPDYLNIKTNKRFAIFCKTGHLADTRM